MNRKMLKQLGVAIGISTLIFNTVYGVEVPDESVTKVDGIGEADAVPLSTNYVNYELGTYPWEGEVEIDVLHINDDKIVSIYEDKKELTLGDEYQYIEGTQKDSLILDNDYLNTKDVGVLTLNVVFKSGKSYNLYVNMEATEKKAEVAPLEGTYDRAKKDNYICPCITFNRDTLINMTVDGKELVYEEDYIVYRTMSSMGVHLKEEFLKQLPIGKAEIKFNFEKSETITYTLNVVDSSIESTQEVSCLIHQYGKTAYEEYSNPYGIAVDVVTQADKLTGISNAGVALEEGEDYTTKINELIDNTTGEKVYIAHNYMRSQKGTVKLTFEFESGARKTIEIEIIDDSKPVTYDRSKEEPLRISRFIEGSERYYIQFKYNGKDLVKGRDFEVESAALGKRTEIVFLPIFLKRLPISEVEVECICGTYSMTIPINIIDSTIDSEIEISSDMEVYKLGVDDRSWEYPKDVHISIHTGKDKLVSISNKGNKLMDWCYSLTKDTDEDMIMCLDYRYMSSQDEGIMILAFDFESGIRKNLKIKIEKPRLGSISKKEATYDYAKPDEYDKLNANINTYVDLINNDFDKITYNGKELVYEEDYVAHGMQSSLLVCFDWDFIKSLPEGKNEVLFHFTETDPVALTINILNKSGGLQSPFKLTIDRQTEENSNTIGSSFKLTTDKEKGYDLSEVKIRYYYTADDVIKNNVSVDNAAISYTVAPWYKNITSKVKTEIVPMETKTETADTYLEISFLGGAVLDKTGTLTIDTRINKEDWSNFDQSNDYSYANLDNVCVYYNRQLVNGVEPK